VIERSHGNRLDTVRSLIERHGMTAIFLAALLPIPDDLLLIPLGMMKYPVRKTVMAMLLGKIGMCLFLAYAGANSFAYFRDVYTSGGDLGVALTIVLLVVIVIAVLRLDWVQLLENHAR
jgi:membrane protein DedA with SNARE-associated domain